MAKYTPNPKALDTIRTAGRAGVLAGATLIQESARVELSQTGKGRKYKGQPTTASAPGQPPAAQTGTLRRSVQIDDTNAKGDNPTARVGTNLAYGRYLEYGTKRIAPRPWLSTALRKTVGDIPGVMARASRQVMGGGS